MTAYRREHWEHEHQLAEIRRDYEARLAAEQLGRLVDRRRANRNLVRIAVVIGLLVFALGWREWCLNLQRGDDAYRHSVDVDTLRYRLNQCNRDLSDLWRGMVEHAGDHAWHSSVVAELAHGTE